MFFGNKLLSKHAPTEAGNTVVCDALFRLGSSAECFYQPGAWRSACDGETYYRGVSDTNIHKRSVPRAVHGARLPGHPVGGQGNPDAGPVQVHTDGACRVLRATSG